MNVLEWFQEGGWTMWAILTSCCVVVPLALIHPIVARPWSLAFTLLLACAPCCLGIGGTVEGRMRTDAAVTNVDPAFASQLREAGYGESRHPVMLGVTVFFLSLAPIGVGEVRRLTRKPDA